MISGSGKWLRFLTADWLFSPIIFYPVTWWSTWPCPLQPGKTTLTFQDLQLGPRKQGNIFNFSLACYEKYDILGTSCSVFSTMWTTLTRWLFEECKPWTHLASLNSWNHLELRESARLEFLHFNWAYKSSGQGSMLSRMPNYCKIKDKLPSLDEVLRLMHLARWSHAWP